jgi:hypothetical protein
MASRNCFSPFALFLQQKETRLLTIQRSMMVALEAFTNFYFAVCSLLMVIRLWMANIQRQQHEHINIHVRLLVEYGTRTYYFAANYQIKMSQALGWPAQENSRLDKDK